MLNWFGDTIGVLAIFVILIVGLHLASTTQDDCISEEMIGCYHP